MLEFTNNGQMALTQAIPTTEDLDTNQVHVIHADADGPGGEGRIWMDSGRQYATLFDPADPDRKPEVVILDHYRGYNGSTKHAYGVLRPSVHENVLGWPVGTKLETRVTAEMLGAFVQRDGEDLFFSGTGTVFQVVGHPILRYGVSAEGHLEKATSHEALAATHFVNLGDVVDTWTAGQEYYGGDVVKDPGETEQWSFMPAGQVWVAKSATAPLDGSQQAAAFNDDMPDLVVGRWYATPMPVVVERSINDGMLMVTEVGFICSAHGGGAAPSVSIGTAAAPTRFANNVALDQITGPNCVHRIPVASGGEGVSDLVFTQTASTTGAFTGRFYWKGFLFEVP